VAIEQSGLRADHARRDFEVLVVDHTISGQTARELAEAFRAKNPNGKVIAIVATPTS
jgi:hypothetical protein